MDFLTPEFFDGLIIAVIMVGGLLAVIRIYRDLTRPELPSPPNPRSQRRGGEDAN